MDNVWRLCTTTRSTLEIGKGILIICVNIFFEAERIEIDEILLNLLREMQKFLDRQFNPKEFAEKLLSASKSDSAIAGQIQKRCRIWNHTKQ
jgi:hypothetical protein